MAQLTSKTIFLLSFLLLFSSSALWSLQIRSTEIETSRLRAATLAEQLSTALTIVAADRTRALDALAGNWPLTNANQIDWFNVQGRSLMKMLPGIHDLWLYDQQQQLIWTIQQAPRIAGYAVQSMIPSTAVNGHLTNNGNRALVVYQKQIFQGTKPQWRVVMLMDPRAIIAALTADWQERSVAFNVQVDDTQLFSSGAFDSEYPKVNLALSFAGGNWTLVAQSQEQEISSLEQLLLYGFIFSLCISAGLARWMQQRNEISALNLVYRSAADVSPDAMFIFKGVRSKHSEHFVLFSCNSAALRMSGHITKATAPAQLIGRLLGLDAFETLMIQVLEQKTPYFQLLNIKQHEQRVWLKLQIVPMPDGVAVTLQDVSKEQQLQQKIMYQANHDQLTGLVNRYAFSQQLESALQQPEHCHLCYIDMDHFKVVNDTCGHLAGDELLKRTAGILKSVLLEHDVLARVGGDEFCMLLKGADLDAVKLRLKALFDRIAQFRFLWEEQAFSIGASIGVVSLDGSLRDVQSALKAADAGCYLAKASGRNRYFIVGEQKSALDHLEEERNCLQLVRAALLNNGFELYAQPIVPLRTMELVQFEVLLRLFRPDGTPVSPGMFIPLAERQGMMKEIDLWVIARVLQQLERFDGSLDKIGKIAINISGTSLGDPLFLQQVKQLLLASSVSTSIICFEITETAAVSNLAQAQAFIAELRQLGCTFSLDDFGVGMSSFGYLRDMQVDYVKIDGSFVRNMQTNHTDAVMVKAISDIAHSLGKKTIAEFVSDDATGMMLRDMGVEYGQGFGLGKPIPILNALMNNA